MPYLGPATYAHVGGSAQLQNIIEPFRWHLCWFSLWAYLTTVWLTVHRHVLLLSTFYHFCHFPFLGLSYSRLFRRCLRALPFNLDFDSQFCFGSSLLVFDFTFPRPVFIVAVLFVLLIIVLTMELLHYFGVSTELWKEDFLTRLQVENSAEQSWELRECLFSNALKCKLAVDGDVLVTRKNGVLRVWETNMQKISGYWWVLYRGVCEVVPCVLLAHSNTKCLQNNLCRTSRWPAGIVEDCQLACPIWIT